MATIEFSSGRECPASRTILHAERANTAHCQVFDKFFIAICVGDLNPKMGFVYFELPEGVEYFPFADDFGPMNLGSAYAFCNLLSEKLLLHPNEALALQCGAQPRRVTNAAFLTGVFMIMKLGSQVETVIDALKPLLRVAVPYRDVSPGVQNFNLYVEDCWRGLYRAKQLSWVDFSPCGFDYDEYSSLDCPLNADLHEIVPGKLVAMRGPKDLVSGQLWQDVYQDGQFKHRDFSPQHYADILTQLGVQAVVRLNEPHYSQSSFKPSGIAVADLCFEDCTPPPVDVVAKFLAIAEAIPGALAVHCKAGLGRTGTLIALYMMKHHGFTAREAMGWLRIVRPGSVIGKQQQFLCDREAMMRRSAARLRPSGVAEISGGGVEEVQRLIDETVRAYDARYAAAMASQAAPDSLRRAHSTPDLVTDGGKALAAHVSEAAERRAAARSSGMTLRRGGSSLT